ncbi:hypothetical protein B1748_31100 [Paenibacillus sp. MY03]|nr:hypothetical protein B1748_31100 [Paenibacillus sp. MY03]
MQRLNNGKKQAGIESVLEFNARGADANNSGCDDGNADAAFMESGAQQTGADAASVMGAFYGAN